MTACECGRPTRHRGICRARYNAMHGLGYQPKVKRRFTVHTAAGKPYVLTETHPAAVEGRTLFQKRQRPAHEASRLLKDGQHNRKIGGNVIKGALRGCRVFTLTLEERATCPRSCAHWLDCYGNVMNWSVRIQPNDSLIPLLDAEVRQLHARFKRILIRLHVLGDFFSEDYVAFWARLLDELPGLHVYGYTARNGCRVARAVERMNGQPRCWIRFSDGSEDQFRAVTVTSLEQAAEVGAIVCPAQNEPPGKSISCGSCALCWSTPKTIAFLRH